MNLSRLQSCILINNYGVDRANFQNWGGRWQRRNKFMRHLKATLEELDIGYRMPLQPVSFHPASAPVASNIFENHNFSAQPVGRAG